MKKLYVLIVVFCTLVAGGYAQTFTWNGPANGNWGTNTNWSPAGVPGAGDSVIFNSDASVQITDASISINCFSVLGSGTDVTILATGVPSAEIYLAGSMPAGPALRINSTNTLRMDCAPGTMLVVHFEENALATIDGTLILDGDIGEDDKVILAVGLIFGGVQVNVNDGGAIEVATNGMGPITDADDVLRFHSGSSLIIGNLTPQIPKAFYHENSSVLINGITNGAAVICDELDELGDVTFNCPALSPVPVHPNLGFKSGLTIQGDLNVLSTNNHSLRLLSDDAMFGMTEWRLNINGNLNVQGASHVTLSNGVPDNLPINVIVNGDLLAGGTALDLQSTLLPGVGTTTLSVKGNVQHTAGTVIASTEEDAGFIVEMSGTVAQNISSHNGLFGADADNNRMTFAVNNAAGVTMSSDLAVGKLKLTAGTLNTGTNVFTIRNASNDPSVLIAPDEASFVNGRVRRWTSTNTPYVMPTGNGVGHFAKVIPQAGAPTLFEAQFYNAPHSTTTVYTPIDGIENFYWRIERVGAGVNAEIELDLKQAVPGADGADAIAAVRYDEVTPRWFTARGTTGTIVFPGTASTGSVRSEVQEVFGLYTFGYGVQDAVLPIKLEQLTAKKVGNDALVQWKISPDSNPEEFEVLKATDGIHFRKIGTVLGVKGQTNYSFTDKAIAVGNNYYRLQMRDQDGKTTLSVIVAVMNGTDGVMISSMMPTIVQDRARLNISSSSRGNIQLVITDISGRVVYSRMASLDAGSQEVWIDAARLSAGIYQVTGYMNGKKTTTIRFFKR